MFRKLASPTYCVLLCIASLFTSCQDGVTVNEPSDHSVDTNAMIVFTTDSTEWSVRLFKEHLLYSEAVEVNLPAPWRLPVKTEAQLLRTLEYASPSGERFVTSDGYTFGMPSSSVSKAGAKTKYSVLGLYIRKTTIDVPF